MRASRRLDSAAPPSPRRVTPGRSVLVAAAVAAAAVASVPLAYLVIRVVGADAGAVADALLRPRTAQLAVNTVGLVAAVSAASLVLGVATAWVLARTDLPMRRLWTVLAALPLAIPSYVAAFGWVSLTPIRGFWGSFVVLVLCNTPLVTLPALAALRLADRGQEDVARTLGRTRGRVFLEVTWPQVRPAALAGVLLVALYVLSDFGSVALMRFQAFTWAIHAAYTSSFDPTLAAVMATVLAAMGVALVAAERAMRGRQTRFGSTVAVRGSTQPIALGAWRFPVQAALGLIAAMALGVPLGALLRYLGRRPSTGIAVTAGDVVADALTTIGLALAGALVALLLALPIGILAARHPSRVATGAESASYVGLALPGIVVGLSLVSFSLQVVPGLYQSVWTLAFAYAVLFLPKAVGAVRSSIERVEPGLEDVARTLGSGVAATWTRVTARIAWPGIGAGMLLVALTAMKELPATLLLRPTSTDTLATSLWRLTDISAYAAAAPYALMLVAVAAVPAVLLTREAVAGRTRVEEFE